MSQKHKIPRIRLNYEAHPLRLYSPTRLAGLFDVDITTLWRWRQEGLMPQPITLPSGKKVWREPDIKKFLEDLHAEAEQVSAKEEVR